ncbi:MAG: CPBP family intramembrane metalloprotease [Planctomycetaceae bacterium]|jgi:sodium transport system permease protein|nr:CPBP family intramembrane metalloprotease [Planctomycetaceae bacterium]MBT6486927.1 CPBP family intramembrane metalloprotease [Planctomycetaceae bacterium]MBT6493611.1 CPBP family intramembrane metalloprotease [Planctomycetaceae bacterium]
MNWRRIKLIFQREIRDQMRDRRTLFMIAVLPLLLYPAMGVGMVRMLVSFQEQPRTVVVLGERELPEHPELIQPTKTGEEGPRRFVKGWFGLYSDADKLDVYTESMLPRAGDPDADPKLKQLLADAKRIRQKYDQRETLKSTPGRTKDEIELVNRQLGVLFSTSGIQVLIIVPDGFGANIAEVNRLLSEKSGDSEAVPEYGRPIIMHNKADKKSQIAYRRVSSAVSAWEQGILSERLSAAHLPATMTTPVNAEAVDLAQVEDISQSLWSVLFPALLIIMSVTGAFYPAIDLAAGEKERGTMETLLICPASRTEIVIGKFLTIMTFSMSTAILNLLSMGLTGNYMMSAMGGGIFGQAGALAPPSLTALMWVLVLLIPLAALFSALCLSLATFAKSSKEGQYYLTPLLMVTLGLTVFCLSPMIEITPFFSVLPIIGPALLLKELLSSQGSAETLVYAIPVLVTSVIYSMLALWWAIELFSREDVLFRESERFELGLWLRHLLREKEATPSFTEGVVCIVMIFFLQFASYKFLGQIDQDAPLQALKLQMMYLVVTVACPALFMAVMLTKSVRQTLRLRWPSGKMLGLAVLLPVALHPLSLELLASLEWFFPQLPSAVTAQLAALTDNNLPLWLVLLVFAVTPAVCEEVAFRGFIMSGFSHSNRKWLPIMLSALAFGLVHMIPQQVFNATLLGVVLGLIVYHSRSLVPAILFHLTYNSLPILRGRMETKWIEDTPAEWFFAVEGGAIRYEWPTLVIAAVLAVVLLRWLLAQPVGKSSSASANAKLSMESDVNVKTSVRV